MAIPVDSLLKLPSQAVYTHHSGQATATVAKKGEVIYVAATCDSLQREVEYYEELYYKARDELEQTEQLYMQLQKEKTFPASWVFIATLIFGYITGAITVIYVTKDKH